jgi:uncharacterized protein (TIGR03435 family)
LKQYVKNTHTLAWILALGAWNALGHAQSPAPAFEVASIRPNKTGGEGRRPRFPFSPPGSDGTISASPGTLSMHDVTLNACVGWAYRVQDSQVSGPEWLGMDRFDIVAKTAAPAPDSQLRVMLQALIADRFTVTLHRESKTMAGYALVVGKNGPKLRSSEGEGESDLQGGKLRMAGHRYSMQGLADLLSMSLRTYVADMTGLKGEFDFTIDIGPFLAIDTPVLRNEETVVMASVFERALEQQLGLKLEGRKIPVEVLVIDHADKPSEN